MSKIIVSIIFPCYNAACFIETAIRSILNQTFEDFELIIIDDASYDNTIEIIKKFNDDRIMLIQKPENTGYTNSLNYGLKISKGEYIARMDADDISLPTRLEKQVNLLKNNPEIILCGSWYQILNTKDIIKLPETHEEIGIAFLEWNPMAHSSVMFRRNVIIKNNLHYDTSMEPSEDYDLWVKLYNYGKIHNIPEVLLQYRQHGEQVSVKKNEKQKRNALLIRNNLLQKLYDPLRPGIDIFSLPQFNKNCYTDNRILFKKYISELNYLNQRNQITGFFDKQKFSSFCEKKKHKLIENYFLKSNQFEFKKLPDFLSLKNKYFRHFKNADKKSIIVKSLLGDYTAKEQNSE